MVLVEGTTMTTTIADILAAKGRDVVTLGSHARLAEAVALLAERRLGAVVIVDDADHLEGVLAERDVVRALAERGTAALTETVAALMDTDLPSCTDDALVDDVAAVMTRGRHRHVPVVEEGRLAGIVSVGDVVHARIDDLAHTADQLRTYVTGGY